MATKAQRFRARQQRTAKPARPAKKRKPRRDAPVDTSRPGISATDRKVGAGNSGARNVSKRAKAKGGAKLESSATGQPSRKSTRKSEGRAKRTTALRRRAVSAVSSPKAKATRAKAKQKK